MSGVVRKIAPYVVAVVGGLVASHLAGALELHGFGYYAVAIAMGAPFVAAAATIELWPSAEERRLARARRAMKRSSKASGLRSSKT
jgi:hypothetical protein